MTDAQVRKLTGLCQRRCAEGVVITRDSNSKERRIHFLLAKLRAELEKTHVTKCRCEACRAARQLRDEFGIVDKD